MGQEKIILKVDKSEGLRLDLYLCMNINEMSRSEVKKEINEGKVVVNNKIEYRPHYKVRLGDEIIVGAKKKEEMLEHIEPVKMDLDVIYEDSDLIVLNKPAGLVTHPATGHQTDTLMNGVVYRFSALSEVGNSIRSGLIHRLDKDTSGIILVGKTNLGLWHYSRLFAEKRIQKTYLVVVKGDISKRFKDKAEITIKSIHARNKLNRKKFASQSGFDGKVAVTRFKFLNKTMLNGNLYSTLFAYPETGRTHQIRVHLSEAGFPVLGDPVYGRNLYKRLMLHAYKIELKSINGKDMVFKADIPTEFKQFIDEHTLEV